MKEQKADNRAQLRSIMELYALTPEDVSDLISVSKHTVNKWRSSLGVMPDNLMDLLNYKIAEIDSDKLCGKCWLANNDPRCICE